MLQQLIKVSLIAVGIEQLTYLDIDGFKIFKFYEHPEISAQIEVMETEVSSMDFSLMHSIEVISHHYHTHTSSLIVSSHSTHVSLIYFVSQPFLVSQIALSRVISV
jgi:hypothetical protein